MNDNQASLSTQIKKLVKNSSIVFTDNARKILEKRYLRKDNKGEPVESPEQMFERIAEAVAEPDLGFRDVETTKIEFFNLLSTKKFFPNSPTFTGAGTPLGQLAACFVLPISDDLGRSRDSIFETLRVASLIQQTGGGNGFSFSKLRPKGTRVARSNGKATGPVGFLQVYDAAFGEVAQGGVRRGANMAVLRVDHPDVRDFIKCKGKEGKIANFNISVAITDLFMEAVKKDTTYDLVNPHDGSIVESPRAREIFDLIVEYAYKNGEPGVLFIDAANRSNPVPHRYELEATNPCVTGDTLVATPQGWKRVENIKVGDSVCTVLGVGEVKTVEINDNADVYAVHFSDGGVVKATNAHQFHVRDSRQKFFEERMLKDVKSGDWVRVFPSMLPDNKIESNLPELSNKEYGFLVGVLVGDGCYTPYKLSKNAVRVATNANDLVWNGVIEDAFAKVGATKVSTYVSVGSRSMAMDPKPGRVVADWVRSLPLEPAYGPDKKLPEEYINSNREFLVGLLDGLYSTDGSVDLSSNHPLLRFHTSSTELAQQLRRILLMFGVHGRISKTFRKKHSINGREIRNDRPKYDVTVSGASFGKFFEQIHLSHPDKQTRMEQAAKKSNFTGGNWAARVKKIEYLGKETVYDLFEPHSDTWITEGYVSRGCGEQWLGSYENCCLGSINLAEHLNADGSLDWDALKDSVVMSTRFLDNVVTANKYVPEVPELREAAEGSRRIGLGFMGLADLMYSAGVRYGSDEGQEYAAQISEFMRFHSMQTSVELARERGSFNYFKGSVYDPEVMTWQPPVPLKPFRRDFGRPELNWGEIVDGIKLYGIRNAAQTTVAPTGTISTVAGIEGYGCEPVFALAYMRNVYQAAGDENKMTLTYVSPIFQQALDKLVIDPGIKEKIVAEVVNTGTCQHISELPAEIRDVFVVSADVTPEEHILMQTSIQAFIDNSISKTCNFPQAATKEDVAKAYTMGWELGAKGLTVYVAGSRSEVVLETNETKASKEGAAGKVVASNQVYSRAYKLVGATYKVQTPQGKAFITINKDDAGNPVEIFLNVGKAGTDVSALSEALGRMMSGWLTVSHDSVHTAKEIITQLVSIGGAKSVGFGKNRVSSLPDAVAKVLAEDLGIEVKNNGANVIDDTKPKVSVFSHTDMCPECGNSSLVSEEGCAKCYNCGYSVC